MASCSHCDALITSGLDRMSLGVHCRTGDTAGQGTPPDRGHPTAATKWSHSRWKEGFYWSMLFLPIKSCQICDDINDGRKEGYIVTVLEGSQWLLSRLMKPCSNLSLGTPRRSMYLSPSTPGFSSSLNHFKPLNRWIRCASSEPQHAERSGRLVDEERFEKSWTSCFYHSLLHLNVLYVVPSKLKLTYILYDTTITES